MEGIEEIVKSCKRNFKNNIDYYKLFSLAALYVFMTYLENNGKMLLIEHGLIKGDAIQITKDFITLNWGELPLGILKGLKEIAIGYSVVLPTDIYLGMSAFKWIRKKSEEYFGKEHYLNKPISNLLK